MERPEGYDHTLIPPNAQIKPVMKIDMDSDELAALIEEREALLGPIVDRSLQRWMR